MSEGRIDAKQLSNRFIHLKLGLNLPMVTLHDRQTQTDSLCLSALFSEPKRLVLGGLSGIALLLVSCQSAPLPAPSVPSASPAPSAPSASSSTKQYENPQAKFSFTYPADFVIADPRGSSADAANAPLTVELWQQDVYDSIVAGKYEGGTEYPPNVQVMVDRNPNRLDLQAWVESQSERFSLPQEFQTRSIAGQTGLSFRSTGLYEQGNVVVAHPDGETVIVISLATIGVPGMDDPNRRAFMQILNSLQFASPTQP